ncbi:aldo/keto reductase [Chryseobacterium wangxinyae]|uniref:aldo/keto reductase n=1 Tax=Chryseobacterium sp. CY353 TaxID=2997334 RepID=UPI0022700733|nr:aldo/keto reductase [Chryseobacterium sp. CY353]MCY0970762.1 aldo/keto reductase [Chryseobacterium sp. CY353]
MNIPGNDIIKTGISQLGLGTMRMPANKDEGIKAIHTALDAGMDFINTGDFYDAGLSEILVGEALKSRKRDDAFVSVKFGGMLKADGGMYGIDSRPELIESYLTYSLKRLGLDYIDLYQPCRINPHVPVEDTIGAISKLVEKGFVRTIGISEVDAATLRRANATHPISLVEVTYSLMGRKIEDELLPTARELGVGVVGFGVLLSGMIGGSDPHSKLNHIKHMISDGTLENFNQNLSLSQALEEIAKEKNITLSQLAIAWVLSQGKDIMALVGSRTTDQVENALKAIHVNLTEEDIERIEKIIPKENAKSDYMPAMNLAENGLFNF